MRGYIPPQTTAEEIFCRTVKQASVRCEKTLRPVYTGFLDERQQQLAAAQLAGSKWSQHLFFGGCLSAERKVLCVYSELAPSEKDFPIEAVLIRAGKQSAELTHRDYLGSLMGLGLKRSGMGDIFLQEDGAIVFAQPPAARTIIDCLTQVGKIGVSAVLCEELPQELAGAAGQELTVNVASLRLDAVLAAALHLSRQNACTLISGGKVQVCHLPTTDSSRALQENDTVTVRGSGRFQIAKVGGKSKKERIFLTLIKY